MLELKTVSLGHASDNLERNRNYREFHDQRNPFIAFHEECKALDHVDIVR